MNDPIAGTDAIKRAREKAGQLFHFLTPEQQHNLRRNFFAQKGNQMYKEGSFVMCDVDFSRKLIKGHNAKRALIAQIKSIDFTEGHFKPFHYNKCFINT